MGYARRLSAPRCPVSVLAPEALGGISSANTKVLVLPIYLPTTGEGWPKARRHENAYLLGGQNLTTTATVHRKTLKTFQETGGTGTHSLQVLHTLYCGTSHRRVSEHSPAVALTQACHNYTHTLLAGVHEGGSGPSGPPVKMQENTALLSSCGLTGMSLNVSLLGREGVLCLLAQRK